MLKEMFKRIFLNISDTWLWLKKHLILLRAILKYNVRKEINIKKIRTYTGLLEDIKQSSVGFDEFCKVSLDREDEGKS